MSKYKIHIDKSLPDSESIEAHKDFDAVFDAYKLNTRFNFWQKLYRKPANFAWVIMALAIGFLVWESSGEEKKEERVTDHFLRAPAAELMPPGEQFASEEGEISAVMAPGIHLQASQEAFVDGSGDAIEGEFSLFVRYLPSAESWISRGLPMEDREAAYAARAVVEVYAKQGEKALQLQAGKSIRLSVDFEDNRKEYLPMQLDTASRTWEYLKDTTWISLWDSSALNRLGDRPAAVSASEELIPKSGRKPLAAPPKPFGVKISNKNQYPYFARYEKVFWEYLNVAGSANPWTEKLLGQENGWNDVKARQTGEQEFTLTFTKTMDNGNLLRKRVKARPLYEAASEAEAEAIYQQKLQDYRDALAAIEEEKDLLMARQEATFQQELKNWEERKRKAVVSRGSRCLIDLHKLGFVGLMKQVEKEEVSEQDIPGGQRIWWTDSHEERLIEISGNDFDGRIPLLDSSFFYKLENGKLLKVTTDQP